jgi:hypothetical protein
MPLPDEALNVDGGCNCGAVRYQVDIPAVKERPLHPLAPTDGSVPVPLPFLVIDHCNDCRRATGSLLPVWMCAPIAMASVSLVRASSASLAPEASARVGPHSKAEEQRGPWIKAADVFVASQSQADATTATADCDHFLKSYESSNNRWRWFCSRCGTSIGYTAVVPKGFPDMLDITMGSIDRHHLEGLVPERHLWWDFGIDWIRRLATQGYGALPIHPDYHLTDTVTLQSIGQ